MAKIEDLTTLSYYHGIRTICDGILQIMNDPKYQPIINIEFIKMMLNNNINIADSKISELSKVDININKMGIINIGEENKQSELKHITPPWEDKKSVCYGCKNNSYESCSKCTDDNKQYKS